MVGYFDSKGMCSNPEARAGIPSIFHLLTRVCTSASPSTLFDTCPSVMSDVFASTFLDTCRLPRNIKPFLIHHCRCHYFPFPKMMFLITQHNSNVLLCLHIHHFQLKTSHITEEKKIGLSKLLLGFARLVQLRSRFFNADHFGILNLLRGDLGQRHRENPIFQPSSNRLHIRISGQPKLPPEFPITSLDSVLVIALFLLIEYNI